MQCNIFDNFGLEVIFNKSMTAKQFINQKERVADYLRRFGLEGELAFHVIAYQYVLCYQERLANLPKAVVQKWQTAYQKIENESYVVKIFRELAANDPLGDKLPEWYQFFIGRRYREGSGKFFTPKPIASAMARFLPFISRERYRNIISRISHGYARPGGAMPPYQALQFSKYF
jgi:hypothetical protein